MELRVGLIGDRNESHVAHRAVPVAIEMAGHSLGFEAIPQWIATESIDRTRPDLMAFAALWCVPASPYRSPAGALAAIRFAREFGRPFLGTCGDFQHALLEYASSLWGVKAPGNAEVDGLDSRTVISPLSCPLIQEPGTMHFAAGSRLRAAYGRASAVEEYHCSYGLNPLYRTRLEDGPMRATAWDDYGDVRGIELDHHPFFVATLFQPERAALRGDLPPVVAAWLASAADRSIQDREFVRAPGPAQAEPTG